MPDVRAPGSIDAMNRSDIDDTVRDMWTSRPHRRRDDRKIAGVAAAIGRRYGIDPILVRVALVVTTIFGGVGILLYLLGWLFLPEEGDEVSGAEALVGQGRSSMSKPLTIVLAIALIPASSGIFTGHVSAFASLAAVAAAVYLLHRHRGGQTPAGPAGYATFADGPTPFTSGTAFGGAAFGDPTPGGMAHGGMTPGGAASGGTAPGAPASGGTAGSGSAADDDATGQRTTPPSWDPLGAAPFAWDLPEPGPAVQTPAPPERRRRSAVTPVTLALALMVAGAGAIVAMSTDAVGPLEVMAATLAVLGAGLVYGSFVRGGRGLIAVAIPLALATYAMAVVPFEHFDPQHGAGDRDWQASTVAEVQSLYRHSFGDATLDLSRLDLSANGFVSTTVELGAGDLKVLLPRNADVEVHCEAGAGDLKCLGQESEGMKPVVDVTDDGPDGEGGGKIVLKASVGAGDLKVSRDEE